MTPRGLLSSALSTQLNIDLLLQVSASRHSTLLTYMYVSQCLANFSHDTVEQLCSQEVIEFKCLDFTCVSTY